LPGGNLARVIEALGRVTTKEVAAVGGAEGLDVFGAIAFVVATVPVEQAKCAFVVDRHGGGFFIPDGGAECGQPVVRVGAGDEGNETDAIEFAAVFCFGQGVAHLFPFFQVGGHVFGIGAALGHPVLVVVEELDDGRDAHGIELALVLHLLPGRGPVVILRHAFGLDEIGQVGQGADRGVFGHDPSPTAVGVGRVAGGGVGDHFVVDFAPRHDDVVGLELFILFAEPVDSAGHGVGHAALSEAGPDLHCRRFGFGATVIRSGWGRSLWGCGSAGCQSEAGAA